MLHRQVSSLAPKKIEHFYREIRKWTYLSKKAITASSKTHLICNPQVKIPTYLKQFLLFNSISSFSFYYTYNEKPFLFQPAIVLLLFTVSTERFSTVTSLIIPKYVKILTPCGRGYPLSHFFSAR